MTKDGRDDWGRIRQVFEAALAQPAERRSAFVAEACRGEDATYDQVVALLESHKNAATFLETPAINLRGSVRPADLTGQRIGPYHIASLIGRAAWATSTGLAIHASIAR
jgi:serine/threonine-protein kinase